MSDLEIDEDFLVFDGEELHRLAGSAADVWRSIRGAVAVGDVIRRLQVLHPGDRNVPGDVRAFIDDLLARGLVEERPTPSDGCSVPSHVAWCVDEDGTVLIADLRSGARHVLIATAAVIWSAAVAEDSHHALLEALADAFPDAPPGYADEVDELLDSLVAEGLLARQESRP